MPRVKCFCLAVVLSIMAEPCVSFTRPSVHFRKKVSPSTHSVPAIFLASKPDADEEDTIKTNTSDKLGPKASPPGWLRKTFPAAPWVKLPNWLTYLRCLAIPGLAGLFYLPGRHIETATVFAVASITDWFDGFLARRWDITSDFGAFLDPVADKLMVSTALVLLSGRYGPAIVLPTAIILAREIAVSALREWMAQRGQRDSVKVGFQGKLKTALTMLSLTLLLMVPGDGMMSPLTNLYLPGIVALYASTVITVTSGSVYFRAAAPVLFSSAK